MPFRFVNTFAKVDKAWIKDVLRQAVEMTFDNLLRPTEPQSFLWMTT